jgi:hypothetical protein
VGQSESDSSLCAVPTFVAVVWQFSAVMTRPNTYIILHTQAGAITGRSLASAASVLSPVYSKCARRYKDV